MSFEHPWILLLWLPAMWLAWRLERGVRPRLSPRRQVWVRYLRLALLTALIVALAEPSWRLREDRLTVVFAVDVSASVAQESRAWVSEELRRLVAEKPPKDRIGVVTFGETAMVEAFPSQDYGGGELLSRPPTGATDLAAAIRLSRGLFAPGEEARIVLVTDGRETQGSVQRAVADLAPEVDLVWKELRADIGPEVLVEQVAAPQQVTAGQTHRIRVVVRSSVQMPATLRLFRGTVPVVAAEVQLTAGESQVFSFDQQAGDASGSILYRARIEAVQDGELGNNEAAALVRVVGRPSVLLVDREPQRLAALQSALEGAGISVVRGGPGRLGAGLADLASYDAIVLSDIATHRFAEAHLQLLAAYTRDLGGGLVMLGGPESFGPGGYWQTPVEEVLPLDMEVKDRSYIPSLGIVLLIDKSGSMAGVAAGSNKLQVAKAAAVELTSLLNTQDRLGVVAFDGAPQQVVPLTRGNDRRKIKSLVGAIRPGGGTDAYPAMKMALEDLRGAEVRVKHVILLTDGQLSQRDHEGLAREMLEAGITVSTVAVGTDADIYTLNRIAQVGGGQFHRAVDIRKVPRIFLGEAFKVGRSWIVEESFVPERLSSHPVLASMRAMPQLTGYVAASEKPGAQHLLATPRGDPLLSMWRVGLGKSIAFTSDAKGGWSADWMGWSGYGTFWTSLLRWSLRDAGSGRLRPALQKTPEGLRLSADLLDREGRLVNGARLLARWVGPDGEVAEMPLEQQGPGRYGALLEASEQGPYLAAIVRQDDPTDGATVSTVVPYADELRALTSAPAGLERLTAAGRLRAEPPAAGWFEHLGTGGEVRRPLAPWLLALAACLLLAEVVARKLAISLRRKKAAEAPAEAPARNRRLAALDQARRRAMPTRAEPGRAESPRPGPETGKKERPPVPVSRPGPPAKEPAPVPSESAADPSAPAPPPAEPAAPAPAGRSGYTARLLEAKRRMRQGRS